MAAMTVALAIASLVIAFVAALVEWRLNYRIAKGEFPAVTLIRARCDMAAAVLAYRVFSVTGLVLVLGVAQ